MSDAELEKNVIKTFTLNPTHIMGIDSHAETAKMPRLLDSDANFHACHEKDDMQTLNGHRPVRAIEPSGAVMQSSKEATISNLPNGNVPPDGTFDGHVMPILKNHSIISLGKSCDDGFACLSTK